MSEKSGLVHFAMIILQFNITGGYNLFSLVIFFWENMHLARRSLIFPLGVMTGL